MEITQGSRAISLRQDVCEAIVKDARSLVAPGKPQKRYLEILLPSGTVYEPSDNLSILPLNPDRIVQ